jgi:hypothetical protein
VRAAGAPLGDWWGTAIGLGILSPGRGISAATRRPRSSPEPQARLINHDLRLLDDELECQLGLTDALMQLGRTPRANASAEQGIALAATIGNPEAKKAFEERLAKPTAQASK